MAQHKDHKRFHGGLNTDADPSELPEGDYVGLKNFRALGSSSQHGAGPIETLQGEIELLIAPDSLILYYGESIGGSFVYSGYDEIQIGTQIWMKKNWDGAYPGSKVYDDEEANASIYGRLYTHNHIMATDFCPAGWRVPTEADIDDLLTYLGGIMIAGGKLKEVGDSHWTDPNTGAVDSSGFRAVPGGKFDLLFDLLGDSCLLWLQDEGVPYAPVALNGSEITYNSFKANWKTTEGATGYYLDVAEDVGFTVFVAGYNNKDVGNVLLDSVTGLAPDTQYYYRVRAYNEIGTSENSNTITPKTTIIPDEMIIPLLPTGDGSGVATLRFEVSVDTTMEIGGVGKFYDDASGTVNPGILRTITAGALRTFYLKVPIGACSIVVNNASRLIKWGTILIDGWDSLANAPTTSISLSALSSSLTDVHIGGNNTCAGGLSDLSNNMQSFTCAGDNTIGGDLVDCPPNLTDLTVTGFNTIHGNIGSLPATVYDFAVEGLGVLTGSISDLPAPINVFVAGNNLPTIDGYTAGRVWADGQLGFILRTAPGTGLSSSEVDNLLIDMANATWSATLLVIAGGCAPRTAASDAAVLALEAMFVTVFTN